MDSQGPAAPAADSASPTSEYHYLDNQEFRFRYSDPEHPNRLYFFVEGVHCTDCLRCVENVRYEFENIIEMRLDMGRHVVEIETREQTPVAPIAARLKHLGYAPHPIPFDSLDDSTAGVGHKDLLIRLGVAGAMAGNVMLLSTSLYSGANQSAYRPVFEWLTFLLYLPILLYCAVPFYKTTWAAIRNHRSSIDIPIVGAIFIGTVIGLYHLVVGEGDIYFDSLAVLVFLLLASRYILFRLQNKFLSPSRLRTFFETETVRIVNPATGEFEVCHARRIRKNDRLLVYGGERIPVDGFLLSNEAFLNTAVLTGESYPQRVLKNQQVFAGTQLQSDQATVIADAFGDATRLGHLLRETERSILSRTPLVSITDHAAQWFSITVLAVGVIFAALYSLVDVHEAINRGLALVILACPCALALATPLTQSLALRKAAARGCLVKKAEAFEKLTQVRKVYLDKTGTLTRGELNLERWWPQPPSEEQRSIIYSLEKISRHPVARVLSSEVAKQSYRELDFVDHRENPGTGVEGRWGNDAYELRSLIEDSGRLGDNFPDGGARTQAALYRNGELVVAAVLSDRIRESSRAAVEVLQKRGLDLFMLTGDVKVTSEAVAAQLGILPEKVMAARSPEDKQSIMKANSKALMVGDGVNDSIALASAHVGVAVQGSMEVSFRAADIYLTEPGLRPLVDLLELGRTAIYIVKRNLVISLIYNSLGAALALQGYISPLIAAVLMPLSSITVVMLSVFGTRSWRRYDRAPKDVQETTAALGPAPMATPHAGGSGI